MHDAWTDKYASMYTCTGYHIISEAYGFLPSSTNVTGGALVKIVHYLMSPGQESVHCREISEVTRTIDEIDP